MNWLISNISAGAAAFRPIIWNMTLIAFVLCWAVLPIYGMIRLVGALARQFSKRPRVKRRGRLRAILVMIYLLAILLTPMVLWLEPWTCESDSLICHANAGEFTVIDLVNTLMGLAFWLAAVIVEVFEIPISKLAGNALSQGTAFEIVSWTLLMSLFAWIMLYALPRELWLWRRRRRRRDQS